MLRGWGATGSSTVTLSSCRPPSACDERAETVIRRPSRACMSVSPLRGRQTRLASSPILTDWLAVAHVDQRPCSLGSWPPNRMSNFFACGLDAREAGPQHHPVDRRRVALDARDALANLRREDHAVGLLQREAQAHAEQRGAGQRPLVGHEAARAVRRAAQRRSGPERRRLDPHRVRALERAGRAVGVLPGPIERLDASGLKAVSRRGPMSDPGAEDAAPGDRSSAREDTGCAGAFLLSAATRPPSGDSGRPPPPPPPVDRARETVCDGRASPPSTTRTGWAGTAPAEPSRWSSRASLPPVSFSQAATFS